MPIKLMKALFLVIISFIVVSNAQAMPSFKEVRPEGVFFEADSASGLYSWMLNNKLLGKSSDIISWSPEVGEYTLSLIGPDRRIIDSLNFVVRGD